jgi:hypothetical protein
MRVEIVRCQNTDDGNHRRASSITPIQQVGVLVLIGSTQV